MAKGSTGPGGSGSGVAYRSVLTAAQSPLFMGKGVSTLYKTTGWH